MKELHPSVTNAADFSVLVEIVAFMEWHERSTDRCLFSKNGFMLRHDESPIDIEDMALPDHVGFFQWGRDKEEADILYQSFPNFDFLLLPIPIDCTIREPLADEKLWMKYVSQMSPYRDQVIEAEKEKRRLKYEHDHIIAPIAAMNRKLDEVLPHARRGLKVLNAASQGGKEASKEQEKKREEIRRELRKMLDDPRNIFLSLTQCRERIAAQFQVSRRSVENYTEGMTRENK